MSEGTSTATRPTARVLDRIEELNGEPEGDDLLEAEAIYRSKGANFSAVRIGRRRWMDQGEQQVSGRVVYDFAPNGEFRTRDKRAVEYLEKLPTLNLEFWRVGAEPGALPSSDAVLERITDLTIELDDKGLEEIQLEEQTTHQRPDVLKQVEIARRKVQGISAEGA